MSQPIFQMVGFDKMQNAFCQALFPLITCVYFKRNLIHMLLIRLHRNYYNVFRESLDVEEGSRTFKNAVFKFVSFLFLFPLPLCVCVCVCVCEREREREREGDRGRLGL